MNERWPKGNVAVNRPIVTEVDESIAVIRFNRPHERNPLSLQTLHDLDTTLRELTVRSDVNAIIFTGTDDVFASGADIRELAATGLDLRA